MASGVLLDMDWNIAGLTVLLSVCNMCECHRRSTSYHPSSLTMLLRNFKIATDSSTGIENGINIL